MYARVERVADAHDRWKKAARHRTRKVIASNCVKCHARSTVSLLLSIQSPFRGNKTIVNCRTKKRPMGIERRRPEGSAILFVSFQFRYLRSTVIPSTWKYSCRSTLDLPRSRTPLSIFQLSVFSFSLCCFSSPAFPFFLTLYVCLFTMIVRSTWILTWKLENMLYSADCKFKIRRMLKNMIMIYAWILMLEFFY